MCSRWSLFGYFADRIRWVTSEAGDCGIFSVNGNCSVSAGSIPKIDYFESAPVFRSGPFVVPAGLGGFSRRHFHEQTIERCHCTLMNCTSLLPSIWEQRGPSKCVIMPRSHRPSLLYKGQVRPNRVSPDTDAATGSKNLMEAKNS
jgi:hypothetical protein